jgi:uncharacterized protein YjbI with pentapeptide repeats
MLKLPRYIYNLTSVTSTLVSALILVGVLVGRTGNLDFLVNSVRDIEVLHLSITVPLSMAFPVIGGLLFLAGFAFIAFVADQDNIGNRWLALLLAGICYLAVWIGECALLFDFLKGQFESELGFLRIFFVLSSLLLFVTLMRRDLALGVKLLYGAVAGPLIAAATTALAFLVAATPLETHEFERAGASASPLDWQPVRQARAFIFDRFPAAAKGEPVRRIFVLARSLSLRDVDETALNQALNTMSRNLAGRNLAGLDAAAANLSQVNFSYAHLTGSYFGGADVSHSLFTSAHLGLDDFARADVRGDNFDAAQLDGAAFTDAEGEGASFVGAHADLVSFDNADFRFADFEHAVLVGSSFERTKLAGAAFRSADLLAANLHDAGLQATSFAYAKLQRVNPFGAIGPLSQDDVFRLALTLDLANVDLGFAGLPRDERDQAGFEAAMGFVRIYMASVEQLLSDKSKFDAIRQTLNFVSIGPDFMMDMGQTYLGPFTYMPDSIEGVLKRGGVSGMSAFAEGDGELNETNAFRDLYRDYRMWLTLAANGSARDYSAAFASSVSDYACGEQPLSNQDGWAILTRLDQQSIWISMDLDAGRSRHAGVNNSERIALAQAAIAASQTLLALEERLAAHGCLARLGDARLAQAISRSIADLRDFIKSESVEVDDEQCDDYGQSVASSSQFVRPPPGQSVASAVMAHERDAAANAASAAADCRARRRLE